MSYNQRAVRTGGYFTAALLLLNYFFSDLSTVNLTLVSLAAGFSFTLIGLLTTKEQNL